MRIDTSGKVGISTDAPAAVLEISSGGYSGSDSALCIGGNTNSTGRTDSVTKYGVVSAPHFETGEEDLEVLTIFSNGTDNSVAIGGRGNSAYNSLTEIKFRTGATDETTSDNAVDRMVIDEIGNVAIGLDTHSARRLAIKGAASDNSENTLEIFNSVPTQLFLVRSDGYIRMTNIPETGAAANMYIDGSGYVHRPTSSRRFKTNIKNTAKGLTELLSLRAVDFNSICPSDDPDKPHTGFIAEEVAEAGFEEYIFRDADNEIQSVQYPVMVALCVKAIQELSAKVTALENA